MLSPRIFPNLHTRSPQRQPRKSSKSPPKQALAVPLDTTLGPYFFFEAVVKVDKETWRNFHKELGEDPGKVFTKLLEDVGLKLRHAGTFTDDEYFTFYNFWELGLDANQLPRAELALADNVLWAEFTKLIQRQEDKNIIFPVTAVTRPLPARGVDVSKYQYLRIEYDMEHFALAEVVARFEADLVSTGERNGWYFGFSYLHLTGREGRLVQIWLVPNSLTPNRADELVDDLPWLRPLSDKDGTELFKEGPDALLLKRSTFDHNPQDTNHALVDALAALKAAAAAANRKADTALAPKKAAKKKAAPKKATKKKAAPKKAAKKK